MTEEPIAPDARKRRKLTPEEQFAGKAASTRNNVSGLELIAWNRVSNHIVCASYGCVANSGRREHRLTDAPTYPAKRLIFKVLLYGIRVCFCSCGFGDDRVF